MSVIRPVLEYACPVWHTMLPKYLSDSIEMVQKPALSSIHPGYHDTDILDMVWLPTLENRLKEIWCLFWKNKKC